VLGGTITNTVVLPRGSHRKDPVEDFAPLSPMQTEIKPRQLLNTLLVVFPILCLCVVIFRAVVRNADVVSVGGKAGLLSGQTALKLRVRISETWHKASAGCQ